MLFDEAMSLERLSGVTRYSLHLARAPFCDDAATQEHFAKALARRLPSFVSSIGVHRTGPLRRDLGFFGLGTAFVPTAENERSAARLLDLLTELTGREVLLENANFYDGRPQLALRVLEAQERLTRDRNVTLILDLAHLIMEAESSGTAPELLLGAVPLERVRVIHLSGGPSIDSERVALGYMANLVLPHRCQPLFDAVGQEVFKALVLRWGADFLQRAKHMDAAFVVRPEEAPLFPGKVVDPAEDFLQFAAKALS